MKNSANMVSKNLINIFLISFVFIACDPDEYMDPSHRCKWIIKNCTEDSLLVTESTFNHFAQPLMLLNDSSILINYEAFTKNEKKDFFQGIYNLNTIDDSVVITNMRGETVKIWKESRRNDPNKQFFNEDFWEKKEWEEGRYIYREWTFEILPEDIHLLKD